MLNLPENGDRVRVWPAPGRRVQIDARPVAKDRGGRYLDDLDEGQEVVWSSWHLEQLRAGDIFLHCPRAVAPALAEASPDQEAEALPTPAELAPRRRSK